MDRCNNCLFLSKRLIYIYVQWCFLMGEVSVTSHRDDVKIHDVIISALTDCDEGNRQNENTGLYFHFVSNRNFTQNVNSEAHAS